jgi:hypothetical protein
MPPLDGATVESLVPIAVGSVSEPSVGRPEEAASLDVPSLPGARRMEAFGVRARTIFRSSESGPGPSGRGDCGARPALLTQEAVARDETTSNLRGALRAALATTDSRSAIGAPATRQLGSGAEIVGTVISEPRAVVALGRRERRRSGQVIAVFAMAAALAALSGVRLVRGFPLGRSRLEGAQASGAVAASAPVASAASLATEAEVSTPPMFQPEPPPPLPADPPPSAAEASVVTGREKPTRKPARPHAPALASVRPSAAPPDDGRDLFEK